MASAIGQSTNYDSNYSKKIYTSEIIAKSLTDGIATFSEGTVTGLVPPTDLQNAVTKSFVDGLVNVANPVNSVQFNNMVFAGSANLTYVPNTLTVNGIINDGSGISISGGIISGLNDPTIGNQIATKNYVDSFTSITANNYIISDTSVTYTAAQVINATILRNLATDNVNGISLTDTTPTATQLVSFVSNASIGYAAKFRIMNDNPNANQTSIEGRDRFVLTINPGTGVSFYPSGPFNLRRGYMLDAYVLFTNVNIPAVTIIINRCSYSGLALYLAPVASTGFVALNNSVDYINTSSMQMTGNLLWNLDNTSISTTNYMYTTANVKNQFVTRNPSGIANDTFGASIDIKYINQIMTIQNPSAFNVVLNGQTNIWKLIPSTLIIPSNKQIILSLTNIKPDITNAGAYYNYGFYDTLGGTGVGLTLTVSGIATDFTITNAGTSYVKGNYTTTNLTTSSASGLIISVSDVIGSGAIGTCLNVVNYLNGGYQNGDIVQINGGDNTATLQLSGINHITGYYINSLGSGAYLSTDILNISGPGTGSGAQITLGSFITIRTIGIVSL
jgi:hypothetical protein